MDTSSKFQHSPDIKKVDSGDKNIEHNINIDNIEQLTTTLLKYGIDIDKWGKGEAKKLEDLFEEIQNKESVLVDVGGKILRKTLVTSVLIKYLNNEGRTFILREEHQGFYDGRIKKREHLNNISIAEKMHIGEDPKESAKRGIKEELSGFIGEVNLRDLGVDETQRLSNSYPGLMSLFTVYRFETFLTDKQFNPSGYVEVQPGKKNICFHMERREFRRN